MERIVVIGGVAAGMSAASQAKRRRPDTEVVVFERGPYVSYGACGMPYNLADPTRPIEDLVVMRPEDFAKKRGIDVRTMRAVEEIDLRARTILVSEGSNGLRRETRERWDKLVIATGASAVRPPIPGLDRPGVFVLRELTDGERIKRHLAAVRPRRAVIVGAGYIGLEMAEALRASGLEVTVLEMRDQAVPGFARELAELAAAELERAGVSLRTSVRVTRIDGDRELIVRTDGGDHRAELVIVSAGIRPNVDLARKAGLRLGESGAIAVDASMRTSAPDVFAAGDCAEAWSLVLDRPVWIPLGTTANKQGKVAGASAAGEAQRFEGIVGTAAFKLFDAEVARTGVGPADLERFGLDVSTTISVHSSRGHAYPGGSKITTVLYTDRASRRLLGAQMFGESVAKRIDVFATALHAKMTIDQIESLDLSYAPPFAPVYDPILIAATVAKKALEGEAS